MRNVQKIVSAAALFLVLVLPSIPEKNNNNYHIKVPQLVGPPKIDGEIESEVWEGAAVIDTFTQFEPQEGAAPSEKTIAYIGHDKEALYLAFRCLDSNPRGIRASLTQRDRVSGDDEVTIYLDTFNDQKRAFTFQVNPIGVQTDGIYTEVRQRGRGRMGFERIDSNWDTYFLSSGQRDNQGYTVEIAIPFKSIRFPNTPTQKWGFQIMRTIRRKNEEIYWHPRSRDVNGFLVQSGIIELNGKIDKGKNIEIMPVVTGSKIDDQKIKPEAGLNLKYGITSDLTLDATYNPDFSQVEADIPQIEVNQREPLYYPEKRPFFLEGKDFYDTPLELNYTRTIVKPQWGIKLSGKVGKTTFGFLSVLDESPEDFEIPGFPSAIQDPSSRGLINIFRMKRDIFSESYIGLIMTDTEVGGSWSSLTKNYNRVAGVDGYLKFQNYYQFSFQILTSQSKAGEEKTGFVPAMNFNLSSTSRHLTFSADWTSIHPDFEATSSYFRRKDIQSLSTRIGYAFLPQNEYFISIRPSFEYRRIYDFNQTLTDEQFNFSGFINGWKQSTLWVVYSLSLERYEGVDFRKKTFRANLSTEPFSWLSGNISWSFGDGIYYDVNPYLGYLTSIGLRVTLKPFTNLRLFYNFNNDTFYREKGGERVYQINLISQRISLQISRTLALRLITDYNSYDKKFYTSFLFSYELRPGTVFYIGIDDNQEQDSSGIFKRKGRYYFVKFSYWWRM